MLVIKGFNSRTYKCKLCGKAILIKSKYCNGCLDKLDNPYSYSQSNNMKKGKRTKLPTFSFELETSTREVEEQLELSRYGFVPTYDSSIYGIEWKSPIYRNFRPVRPVLNFLDKLLKEHPNLINRTCGTHIHVGVYDKDEWDYDWLEEVFYPLTRYMKQYIMETQEFWGRFFGDYCRSRLDFDDHYSWFNPYTKYNTLEWRLPRFRSAEQFYRVMRWCVETTAWLETNLDREPNIVASELLEKYKEAVASV